MDPFTEGNAVQHLDLPPPASPRIPDELLALHPGASRPPEPHTPKEVPALVAMLGAAGATCISLGHGRHAASVAAASAVADAWTRAGGQVLTTASWAGDAASWLRPARQLLHAHPDAWVIVDNPAGCAQLARRLAEHESWSPARTFGTASLDSPDAGALAGFGVLTGMRGVTRDGTSWRIGHGVLIRDALSSPPISRSRRRS